MCCAKFNITVRAAVLPALHQCLLYCQDLNLQPLLLKELDASYDVVLCVNGIQYLTQPETVLCEVRWGRCQRNVMRMPAHLPASIHCLRNV